MFATGVTRSALAAAVLSAVCLAAPLQASEIPPKARKAPRVACRDTADAARPLELTVDGEPATGQYALPKKAPRTLVVFGHGWHHTSVSWVEHMKTAAQRGFAAVTMDYRGLNWIPDDDDENSLPSSTGWNAKKGGEDLLAAAQFFDRKCSTIETVVIFGLSMGGNMSGLAVAEAGRRGITKWDHEAGKSGDEPLFDYWLDVEGAVNVTETYLEARLLAPANATAAEFVKDVEEEMGGPIEEKPDAYRERTVVARTEDIGKAGLDGAVVIHALNDGLVLYNQAREMATALRGLRVPTEFFTISTRDADSERETTITGYVTDNVDPKHVSPLAGHASETSKTHIVMNVAFDQLWQLGEGATVADSEVAVYGTTDDKNPNYAPGP